MKVLQYNRTGKLVWATLVCLLIFMLFQEANSADTIQTGVPSSVAHEGRTSTGNPSTSLYRLDLAESLQLAIRNNRDIQIGTMFPAIAREAEKSTAAVYDPALFAESNIYKTDRPIQSILDNGTDGTTGKSALREDGWYARTGIRKPLPTGGAASVFIETNNLDSNSELVIPNPQYTSHLTVQLRQALLKEFGDSSNKANIKIATINVKIAEEQYKKNLLDVLRDVAVSYWRFAFYFKQLQISREAVAAAEKICSRLASKKELGLANMLDIDKANAVLQNRRLNQFADNRNYKTAMEQLKLLLGFSDTADVSNTAIVPTEPIINSFGKLDRASTMARAISTRPEMSIARLEINSAETDKQLARHKQLPTLDAIASYTHNALGDDFGTTVTDTVDENQASWSIGVEFEFPLGGQKSAADFRKASLIHNRKQLELSKVQEQIGFEISSAIAKIEELSAEIKAADAATSAYQRVVQREKTRFEINKIDNQRLLDAQDDYYQAEGNALRTALSLNIAILDLSWAKGVLIEDLHIDLQEPAVTARQ